MVSFSWLFSRVGFWNFCMSFRSGQSRCEIEFSFSFDLSRPWSVKSAMVHFLKSVTYIDYLPFSTDLIFNWTVRYLSIIWASILGTYEKGTPSDGAPP